MLSTPHAFRIWMARPEKPHCGNWAVPFMNSTTGVLVTVSLIQVCTSLIWFAFGEKWGGCRHFIRKPERGCGALSPVNPGVIGRRTAYFFSLANAAAIAPPLGAA